MDAPVISGLIAAGGLLLNALITVRATGRTEGVVTTQIGALNKRLDDIADGMKRTEDKLENEQDQQWRAITSLQQDVAYEKGQRANGKAFGMGGGGKA